ncbi:biotin/lipoyl-binding protein [Microbacterium sp. ARD32]|uniref:efflux RND transporter periplasmic adaptor subunit n=1 Tax=Microbacterium sp. ARD32 TaxID=2962577 RepID=UPI002881AFDC|nr:biotin/lipoyl-binding protein [Microbacterium sp. ARD32]MDT0156217.1 biotin/lipoyl-binding protein [Microbacterium sp. ARD32]
MGIRELVRRTTRRTWLIVGAVVLVAAGTAVWMLGFVLPSQPQAQPATRTATATLETMQKVVTTSGTVTPAVNDDVTFTVSGVVTEVAVKAGDTVEQGALLAKVDTLELDADLLSAKASLAEAQATLASAKSANDGSTAATARVSAAAAAVEVQQAQVADAESAVSAATLVAPAAGLITDVGIEVGDRISGTSGASGSSGSSGGSAPASGGGSSTSSTAASSASGISLVSTDSWSVDVSVGETDIAQVKSGLQVELTTADGDTLFGTVSEVGLVPSTTSGSPQYPVAIAITGDGEGLFDGVSVDVDIVYERRTDVLTVPSAAVTTADGASTVTIVAEDGTQRKTEVQVGETSGSLTEITSGLSEGDGVLVASFTPGEGNSNGGGQGQFPGRGQLPGGQIPDGFQPPSGGFPGAGNGSGSGGGDR